VHPAHRHGVVGDDQVTGVGLAHHGVEQVAEAIDIGIVERGIDFVEHADRRGIGQEQGEDQRDRGQRLFAARKQGQRLQPLARRLGEDLQPGFQRVVAVDQREVRLPPFEQAGEQAPEMGIDLLEGGAQPFAPLAVEVADRTAQAGDRLGQLGLFGRAVAVFFLDLRQFLGRDEVDRADPLAAGGQAFERLGLGRRIADIVLVEVEPAGEQGRRALETLARAPSISGSMTPEKLWGKERPGLSPTAVKSCLTMHAEGVLALEDIVIVLVNLPGRLVEYLTLITPVSPGMIGSFGQVGTVHPQDPFALVMINGSLPVFVKANSLRPSPLYSTVP